MSKTVEGYVQIRSVSFPEIVRNPKPCVEIISLGQEAGILPQGWKVYVGRVRMWDRTELEGIVFEHSQTQRIVITEQGIFYDDMTRRDVLDVFFEFVRTFVPANYEIEKRKNALKGRIKSERKRVVGSKIILEVEML